MIPNRNQFGVADVQKEIEAVVPRSFDVNCH